MRLAGTLLLYLAWLNLIILNYSQTPLNKDLNPLNSFNQVSPLIIKNMSKKGGMRSLSNSKLLGVEPVTSLPVLNKKGSTRNILTSDEMIKNKKQEGKLKTN